MPRARWVALFAFLGVIVLLLFLIAKWRWHVFLALLVPLLLFGVIPGVQRNNFIDAFEFGLRQHARLDRRRDRARLDHCRSAQAYTGAIQTITQTMVNVVGSKRMPLALTLTGFVLGIAIFSRRRLRDPEPASALGRKDDGRHDQRDVDRPRRLAAAHPRDRSAHARPARRAAAIVGADIGTTIIFGGIACLAGSLGSWVWGQYVVGPRIPTMAADEYVADDFLDSDAERPGRVGLLCADRPCRSC